MQRTNSRWLRVLFCVGILLGVLARPELVRAFLPSGSHYHSFPGPEEQPISLSFDVSGTEATPNQVLSLQAMAWDYDHCGGTSYGYGTCALQYWVTDQVTFTYSASGGELGNLDQYGQFQPNSQWPTHFRCGPPGTASISVTAVDRARTPPYTGEAAPPYNWNQIYNVYTTDDTDVTQTVSVLIEAHEHDWQVSNDIPSPTVNTGGMAMVGEKIAVSVELPQDWDNCWVEYCTMGGMATNATQPVAWMAGAGAFGYFDGVGQWTPSSDPLLITHWEAPATPGDYTLTVRIDDLPTALDPELGQIATYDDAPSEGSATVSVMPEPEPPHEHQWENLNDLSPGAFQPPSTAGTHEVIPLNLQLQDLMDTDRCIAAGCPWQGAPIPNQAMIVEWSDGNAGGTFGYMGGPFGTEFVPTLDPAMVSHYRTSGIEGTVTLTATFDDQWMSLWDAATWTWFDAFDDAVATVSRNVQVIATMHVHQWSDSLNHARWPLMLERDGVETMEVFRGELLEIHMGELTPDYDQCIAPGCIFPNGMVTEPASEHRKVRFKDDTGGKFGMLDATGEFIPLEPTATSEITHYQVSPTAPITHTAHVWVQVDDAGFTYAGATTPTSDDPAFTETPTPESPWALCLSIMEAEFLRQRSLSGGDACGCTHCAPGFSSIDPLTGAVMFDVPVTGWVYRGSSLGFSVHYNSNLRADPAYDMSPWPNIQASPDFSHFATRNSRWTHSWAQFVEVIQDEVGEEHALWHNGSGGVVSFRKINGTSLNDFTWEPNDSFHNISSAGEARTWAEYRVASEGGNTTSVARIEVRVPYGTFEITDAGGTRHQFSRVFWQKAEGAATPFFLLTRVIDRWGRTVDLTWQNDYLQSVVDGAGRGLGFTYQNGLLAQVNDPNGRHHTFDYTNILDDWGVARQRLNVIRVEGPGFPNRVNYVWGFSYGSTAQTVTHYGGHYTGDLVIAKTEPGGKIVNYAYEGVSANRGSYDDWDGRLVRTWYLDTTEGGREKAIARTGTTLTYPGGKSVTYEYAGNSVVGIIENQTGRYVRYTYDTLHNLTSVRTNREPEGSPALMSVVYTFAENNRTITGARTTNALGDIQETTFGPFNQPLFSIAYPRQIDGQPHDQRATWTYNAVGDVQQIRAGSYQQFLTTNFSYDYQNAAGVPSGAYQYEIGRLTSASFDVFGRPIQYETPNNLLAPPSSQDNKTSKYEIEYNSDGLPWQYKDPVGRTSTMLYSGQGDGCLALIYRRPGSNFSRVAKVDAYGNVYETIDEAGVTTAVTYNGDGQPLQVTQAVGEPEQRIHRYEYNIDGTLARYIPPKGSSAAVEFDYRRYTEDGILVQPEIKEGQATRIRHADGSMEFHGYDSTGALAWMMRPFTILGSAHTLVTRFQYDALHRPIRVIVPSSPDGIAGYTAEQWFDEYGRIVKSSDAAGTTTITYDGLSRPITIASTDGRRQLSYQYVSDPNAHRWITRITVSGIGTWESYEDGKGRLHKAVNPLGHEFINLYNPAGEIVQRRYRHEYNVYDRPVTDYSYLPTGELDGITHYAPDGGQLDRFAHEYDVAGRLVRETDSGGRVHQYFYDALGQLREEEHPDLGSGIQYAYDAHGNRRQVTRNGQSEWYGVDLADKLLWTNTSADAAPAIGQAAPYNRFSYDAFGQLASRDRRDNSGNRKVLDFQWSADGRLHTVQESGSPVFWAGYTGDGERIRQGDSNGTRVANYGLFEEHGGAGTLYTPGLHHRKGGQDRLYHHDRLGSTRYLTNHEAGPGAIPTKAALRYDAFGELRAGGGSDFNGGAQPTSHQFAGHHGYQRTNAAGVGLDYLYQRYYDPAVGRFISQDPTGWAGGDNLYGYCDNDPVNFADPLGLWKTGSYGGDVLEVFRGYRDILNPINAYHGIKSISSYAGECGVRSAAALAWQGMKHSYTAWWHTSDPREFGQSFGTVLTTAVPIARRIGGTDVVVRIMSKAEAEAVHAAGGFVPSTGEMAKMLGAHTRILYPSKLPYMLSRAPFNNRSAYSHVMIVRMRRGWRKSYDKGGAVIGRDGYHWAYHLDMTSPAPGIDGPARQFTHSFVILELPK